MLKPGHVSSVFLTLLSILIALPHFLAAQALSSVSLVTSPNPSQYGQPVTLTATVAPPTATGRITFYDGALMLGVMPISQGSAALQTVLLSSGSRSLRAYYSGDSAYAASVSSSATQTVLVAPSLGFHAPVNFPLGNQPENVVVGDFNEDGKLDFVVDDVEELYLVRGKGDGTFLPAVGILPGIFTYVAVADVNGDGHSDLVAISVASITVLLGKGDGTFQTPVGQFIGPFPTCIATGDFNGDGKADLVLGLSGGPTESISVALGNGDGTFQNPTSYPTGTSPVFIAVADFNQDGIPDLAVANHLGGTISIFLGNGNGTFQGGVEYITANSGASPASIAVADFNGDGNVDLAVTNSSTNQLAIFLGDGTGKFQTPMQLVGLGGNHVVAADLNGDGKFDLAVVNSMRSVNIFFGNGDGTFNPAGSFSTPNQGLPGSIVVGEFSGDARADLIIADFNDMTVLLNGSNPDLTLSITHVTSFTRGQTSALYKITVGNIGDLSSAGAVNTSVVLPLALTATAMAGAGWNCTLATLICSRVDILAVGSSFPPITLTVNVANDAALSLTATANVSGGGDFSPANNSASDVVHVGLPTATTLTSSPNPSVLGQSVGLTASVSAGTGKVTFFDGTTILGIARLSGGLANLSIALLPVGTRQLRAQYDGDSTYGPSMSAVLQQSVTAISAGTLTGTTILMPSNPYFVTVGDFNGDGIPDLVTSNNGDHSVSICIGNGNGTFRNAVNYGVNDILNSVVVADFNGDGKPDLALAMNNVATVALLMNKGDGTFYPAVYIPTGAVIVSMAVGDFNQDGLPDLALALTGPDNFVVLLGNGDGTFQPSISSNGTGLMAVGDFNGDGKADLAVILQGPGTIGILLGNGDGTFQAPLSVGGVFSPSAIAVGDFNGDGKQDVVIGGAASDTYIALGNGDGSLQLPVRYASGGYNYSVAVGDFNGDGKLDVAASNWAANRLTVMLGNGDGTLQPAINYPTGPNPYSIVVADFNGDGKSDVAVANSGNTSLTILMGTGGASFSGLNLTLNHVGNFITGQTGTYTLRIGNFAFANHTGTVTVTDSLPISLTASAISGNGWNCTLATLTCTRADPLFTGTSFPDIALTVNIQAGLPVSTVVNMASVTTTSGQDTATNATHIVLPSSVSLGASPNPVAFGQALILTAVVSGGVSGRVLFYDNTVELGVAPLVGGSATLITRTLGSGIRTLRATYSGDAGSGPSTSPPILQSVRALASSGLSAAATYQTGRGPSFVAVGDFNNDGKTDIAVANKTDATVSIFLGKGDGSFQSKTDYPAGTEPGYVAVADFNGDGKLDLAVTDQDSVRVLLGAGDGSFSLPARYLISADPVGVAVGDFNGDGIPDIALAKADSSLSLLMGNGDGSFQPPTNLLLTFTPSYSATGDLDGDGKPDLAVAEDGPNVHTFLGTGNLTFQSIKTIPVDYPPPIFVAAGDLNGDGKLDLVAANNTDSVFVLLGNGDGTFQAKQSFVAGGATSYVAVGDIDGDGYADLVVGNARADSNQIFVLRGNGNGSFQPAIPCNAGIEPASLAIADFNGDGLADLAVANVVDGSLSVLLGIPSNAALPPAAVSVAPASGTGIQQTFALHFSDGLGATDLSTVFVYFNSSFSAAVNACLIEYDRASNTLFLFNDTGTAWIPMTLGAAGSISNSQCSINTGAATVNLSGTDLTLNLPITFAPGYSGAKNTYAYAAGSFANSGWQTLGTWTVPVVVSALSMFPASGSGLQQTFTFHYSDGIGSTDLSTVFVWFSSAFTSAANSCFIEYNRSANSIYLLNDAGAAWTSAVVGAAVTLSNSQCSINADTSVANLNGNDLALVLPVTFAAGYGGAKNAYSYVSGSSANSGWQTLGTWNVTSTVTGVSAISALPAWGNTLQQTFALHYSDAAGATDLSTMFVWFNSAFSSAVSSCFVEYDRPSNTIFLLNDSGAAWTSAPVGAAVTLSNSQCSINAGTASVTSSGPNLTLNLPVTFAAGYFGSKNIYSYAAGSASNSGWQTLGTWTVPLLSAVSVTPASGNAASQTFSFHYADGVGAADLSTGFIWFNAAFTSAANSCLLEFYRPTNTLYLLNDAGSAWTSGIVGSAGTLSNSQCAINTATATTNLSGNDLLLTLPITFAHAFAGTKSVFSYISGASANSGWQTLGSWIVP
jgi:Bacterial Ig-like domain (group 3)/FG-GAP-like repeat/FG-GAP repeat